MTAAPIAVLGCGHQPNRLMLIGEAPGATEAARGRPFVGKAGEEQEWHLRRHGLTAVTAYRTNVCKDYLPGNPDPTPAQIRRWSPVLEAEIAATRPEVIVAVGRFAMRWLLGEGANLETCHGMVYEGGAFDRDRRGRAHGALVVPVYHPAMGLHDGDTRALIGWDYGQVARVVEQVERRGGRGGNAREQVADEIPYDECEGNEDYIDVSGGELRKLLSSHTPRNLPAAMGLDTEGSIIDNAPANPWAVQISTAPGTAYVLRCEREDFSVGIATIQQLVDWGVVVVMHNAMFDVEMSRLMGLQLSHPDARIYDTQYGAYVTRHEPQALKALARRRCGMEMASYEDTVGDAGLDKQLAYLWAVADGGWPKPEAQLVMSNDGTARVYQPQTIQRTAERILSDWYAEVRNTKGARADLFKRWYGIGSTKQVGRVLRGPVEGELGRMPIGTLADIPLTRAVEYAGRDADAALRVYEYQVPALREADLLRTVDDGMSVLPVFEEMQAGGIPALRSHFVKLAAEMNEEMAVYQSRISSRYCGNRPFNPKSNKDVGALIRRRGLVPKKRTATGAVSTSKDSIEYLRYTDPAISDVFEWRERQHTRDTFALPTVERIPEAVGAGASASVGVDGIPYAVRSRLKVTRTATRRLAAADPNVLAITTHGDLGRRIKEGYVCPDGELFGAWDLSGIEMRYMAHESGDSAMCGVFRRGDDIHDNTASYIFDLPIEELDKRKHRVPAKRTGFGINYGQGPHGLATKLLSLGLTGWTVEACEGLIDGYLSVYPDVDRYMRDTRDELAAAGGRVVDYWGMPRELPGISHPEPKVRSEAGRIAVSHKIQGGAQGMIQRSMAWLRPRIWDMQQAGWNVRWVLQVHDELLLRFDEGLAEVVGELVLEALTEHAGIELCVPVEADGAVSKTWAGLKG